MYMYSLWHCGFIKTERENHEAKDFVVFSPFLILAFHSIDESPLDWHSR